MVCVGRPEICEICGIGMVAPLYVSYSSSEKKIRNTKIYKAIMLFFSFCYAFTVSMSIYLVFSRSAHIAVTVYLNIDTKMYSRFF